MRVGRSWRWGRSLAAAVALVIAALGTSPAHGQEPRPETSPAETPPIELPTVTVTATRTPRAVEETPGTVSVIGEEEIERELAGDIKDLIRYEPGVSVRTDPNRYGHGGFNIRGIDGNRVAIQVDGVRIPDQLTGTIPLTRDYVDLEALESVEIIRGPASALYGSDAIGGVVSFITKDPADYLARFGRPWYASGKGAYYSASETWVETVTLAGRAGPLDALLLLTRRDGHETENNGATPANPKDIGSNSALAKLVWRAGESSTFRLTGEFFERDTETDVVSDRTATLLSRLAEEESRRRRVSLAHEYRDAGAGLVQAVRWQVYYQDGETRDTADERRIVGGSERLRLRDNAFLQEVYGVDLRLESNFRTWVLDHRLTYGLDGSLTETSRPRDGIEYDLTAGTSTRFIGGEAFPNKTFVDTDTWRAGVYVQDEIGVGPAARRTSIIPAVRLDYYRLNPRPDADFARINTRDAMVDEVSEFAVSPKLGVIVGLTRELAAFVQYARGFRSPPYDEVGTAFTNFTFGYTVLPNPDLRPETSDGFEVGLRGAYRPVRFRVVGFYNLYDDFIETVPVGEVDGLDAFQARNLTEVRIFGAEAEVEVALGAFWPALEGFRLVGAAAYAEGDNEETDQPLDSVAPPNGVVSLRYREPRDRWGAEVATTIVAPKHRVADDGSGGSPFRTPGFVTADLTAYYNVGRRVTLAAGVFNVLDRKYWLWDDVRGLAADDSQLDLYTQPGRHASASVTVRF